MGREADLADIAICVPVRDEAESLPVHLDALLRQIDLGRAAVHLCFFLDGCTDGSEAILRQRQAGSTRKIHLCVDADRTPPNAGHARRHAMNLGLRALDGAGGLLLTTDADSVPADDWVARTCDALAQADVVAGRIVRSNDRPSPQQDRLDRYYDRLFSLRRQLDPVPWESDAPHHQVGGANLGFRSEAYQAVGGFCALPTGEDARIVDDAARAGYRVRRDRVPVVHTSARRVGRARGGLACALAALEEDENSATVAHPEDVVWQYRLHAAARIAFDEHAVARLAEPLSLSADHLAGVARDCPNSEAFAMRIVPTPPRGMRHVMLRKAEALLDRLVGTAEALSA